MVFPNLVFIGLWPVLFIFTSCTVWDLSYFLLIFSQKSPFGYIWSPVSSSLPPVVYIYHIGVPTWMWSFSWWVSLTSNSVVLFFYKVLVVIFWWYLCLESSHLCLKYCPSCIYFLLCGGWASYLSVILSWTKISI